MEALQRFRLWYAMQPRALRTLVAINVVLYLIWQVVLIHIGPTRAFVWDHLALNPDIPGILYEPWQLLTYAFLHLQPGLGGLLHMGFNMLWLWWIGRDLEELRGPEVLVATYVYGALGGALLTVMLHGAFPGAPMFSGVVHGASGSVLGVMAAVAVLYPFKSIGLFLVGVVKIRHVVIGLLALDILFLSAGGTSISAHFGGAAAGVATARIMQLGTNVTGWARIFFGSGRTRRGGPSPGILERLENALAGKEKQKSSGDGPRGRSQPVGGVKARVIRMDGSTRPVDPEPAQEVVDNDIDRILDKISEKGYDALTPEEKRVLYEASGK